MDIGLIPYGTTLKKINILIYFNMAISYVCLQAFIALFAILNRITILIVLNFIFAISFNTEMAYF